MSEFDKMIQGEMYNPYDKELEEMRLKARQAAHMFNQIDSDEARLHSLEFLFSDLGENCKVYPNIRVDYGFNVTVGDNFYADFNCVFLDSNKITIGDNVNLDTDVSIITSKRPRDPEPRSQGLKMASPIVIKDNVWIGPQAIILGGVTIGENAIVEAGSVVRQDVPDNAIVSGNPAQVIQEL